MGKKNNDQHKLPKVNIAQKSPFKKQQRIE